MKECRKDLKKKSRGILFAVPESDEGGKRDTPFTLYIILRRRANAQLSNLVEID